MRERHARRLIFSLPRLNVLCMRVVSVLAQTLVTGLLVGCGPDVSPAAEIGTDVEALRCSEQVPVSASGVATATGCSFIQQTENIRKNGQDLAGAELRDGAGLTIGHASFGCSEWIMGVDADDTTIIVSARTGEIRSHGSMHAGNLSSQLGTTLSLPLTY